MGTSARLDRIAETSPRLKARIAGVFYLLTFVTGGAAAVFVSRRLVGYGESANLVATASYIVVTLFFYDLFKPVSRSLSLLAAFFGLMDAPFRLLASFISPAPPSTPLVFFGFYCFMIGYLILRSTFCLEFWVR